jgi:hypothetical protein
MWGDDRTSTGFEVAPTWFRYVKFFIQIMAILTLFFPLRLRRRPFLLSAFFAMAVGISLYFTKPLLEAEFILVNSSLQLSVLAFFLAFARPNATFEESDISMLFYLFLGGLTLQVIMFLGFGRLPSHSIESLFIRFNGITNDSLSAGFLLAIFIAWAVNSSFRRLKLLAVIGECFATGSLFSAIFVPVGVFFYLIYKKLYKLVFFVSVCLIAFGATFYAVFDEIIELKLVSILTHLRFFLNLSNTYVDQTMTSCSEEFCESFIESGLNLNPTYLVLFYGLMISFIFKIFRSPKPSGSSTVYDTLRIYGVALLVGSAVHPVPLIPFAIPLFLILTSLYLGEATEYQPATLTRATTDPVTI